MVFFMQINPDEAYKRFSMYIPHLPLFRDASAGESTFSLSIPDIVKGLAKAKQCGFFEFSTFDFQAFVRIIYLHLYLFFCLVMNFLSE